MIKRLVMAGALFPALFTIVTACQSTGAHPACAATLTPAQVSVFARGGSGGGYTPKPPSSSGYHSSSGSSSSGGAPKPPSSSGYHAPAPSSGGYHAPSISSGSTSTKTGSISSSGGGSIIIVHIYPRSVSTRPYYYNGTDWAYHSWSYYHSLHTPPNPLDPFDYRNFGNPLSPFYHQWVNC